MKYLLTLLLLTTLLFSCSKSEEDTSSPASAEMQKSTQYGWVGFYQAHITVTKTAIGEARITIPIVVFSDKLKTINLYNDQGKQIWSTAAKSSSYTIVDHITDYSSVKTHNYNFEFILTDETKIRLDDFPITLN